MKEMDIPKRLFDDGKTKSSFFDTGQRNKFDRFTKVKGVILHEGYLGINCNKGGEGEPAVRYCMLTRDAFFLFAVPLALGMLMFCAIE